MCIYFDKRLILCHNKKGINACLFNHRRRIWVCLPGVTMMEFRTGETHGVISFVKHDQQFRFALTAEGDVYIRPSLVNAHKDALVEGATVKLVYESGERSLVATEILSVRESSEFCDGEVKFFNLRNGFGFLTNCDTLPGVDIFLHVTVCKKAGIIPEDGMKLQFAVVQKGGKFRASMVRTPPKVRAELQAS
jgi:cold shock CspA family protein